MQDFDFIGQTATGHCGSLPPAPLQRPRATGVGDRAAPSLSAVGINPERKRHGDTHREPERAADNPCQQRGNRRLARLSLVRPLARPPAPSKTPSLPFQPASQPASQLSSFSIAFTRSQSFSSLQSSRASSASPLTRCDSPAPPTAVPDIPTRPFGRSLPSLAIPTRPRPASQHAHFPHLSAFLLLLT